MSDLPVLRNGRPIGECIYCGSTSGLSDEHAVPYAINGPWTLLDASCPDCCNITHRFERDTIHGLFPAMRAVFQMQTRRKKNRPTTLPLLLVTRDGDRFIRVPLKEFPFSCPSSSFHLQALSRVGPSRRASGLRSSISAIWRVRLALNL